MERKFYLNNDTAVTIGQFGLVGLIIYLVGLLLWWNFIRVDAVIIMAIRSKEWSRNVMELEDYQVWVCHTKYRTSERCTYVDGKRQCTTDRIPYQDCGWETRTRVINQWPTNGVWPVAPYWPEYSISAGHYEKRSQYYTIKLSDDKELWNHTVPSEASYDTFQVRGSCAVSLNWWRVIIKVENCNGPIQSSD